VSQRKFIAYAYASSCWHQSCAICTHRWTFWGHDIFDRCLPYHITPHVTVTRRYFLQAWLCHQLAPHQFLNHRWSHGFGGVHTAAYPVALGNVFCNPLIRISSRQCQARGPLDGNAVQKSRSRFRDTFQHDLARRSVPQAVVVPLRHTQNKLCYQCDNYVTHRIHCATIVTSPRSCAWR
jgi:hypothetical protein